MYSINCHILLPLLFCLTSFASWSQDNFTGFWQPQLALNYDVSPIYTHNFSLASRNYFYRDGEAALATRQIDLSHFSNFKTSFNTSVGAGIQYRFRETFESDKENELRLIQQFNITKKFRVVRMGNRFRTEQRITSEQTIHRFRYRFAIDLPIMGLKLDVGEPYFVVTTESLLSIGKTLLPEYDQRITPQLGWLLSEKTKLQLGLEYRFENYTRNNQEILFILNSLIVSF